MGSKKNFFCFIFFPIILPAFATIDFDNDLFTGTLAVAQGGTNLAAGVDGGILGYTTTGTIASSALLTASQVLIGGGAGATGF